MSTVKAAVAWSVILAVSPPIVGIEKLWLIVASGMLAGFFGACAGVAAAYRRKKTTAYDLINHALNLGMLGSGFTLVGFLGVDPDIYGAALLVGLSILISLAGLPVIDVISTQATKLAERFFGGRNDE